MSEPLIRAAAPADAPALAALHAQIYAEGRWFVGDAAPSVEVLRGRLRGLEPTRSLYLVALCGRALCGWLELHRLPPKKLAHVAVLTLAVGQPYRRQGIAARLLAGSYPWGREVGVLKLQLSVRARNEAAITLYRREGFVLEGRERAQVMDDEGFEDNLVMAKFLRTL